MYARPKNRGYNMHIVVAFSRHARLHPMADEGVMPSARLGHRLLRLALVDAGLGEAAGAQLAPTPRGRPRLAPPADCSLSHCAGCVICALSTDGAVGVDVEDFTDATADLFPTYLDDRERNWAGSDPSRFLSVWTRKEAVAKAAGDEGLAAVRRVALDPAGCTAVLDGRVFRTAPLAVGPDHVAHVAHPGESEARIVLRAVSPDILMSFFQPEPIVLAPARVAAIR
jgi:4'-phosphopantetheinyl transferase